METSSELHERGKIIVVGRVACRPEQRQELLSLLEGMQERSRREDGCLSYGFFEAIETPNSFVAVEEWASREALDRHFAQPHLAEFAASLPAAIDGIPSVELNEVAGVSPFPGAG
jgi:quinol monooxygenase YgiN